MTDQTTTEAKRAWLAAEVPNIDYSSSSDETIERVHAVFSAGAAPSDPTLRGSFTFGTRKYLVFDQLEGGDELDVLDVSDTEGIRLSGFVRDLGWGFVPFDTDGFAGETSLTLRAAVEQLAGL